MALRKKQPFGVFGLLINWVVAAWSRFVAFFVSIRDFFRELFLPSYEEPQSHLNYNPFWRQRLNAQVQSSQPNLPTETTVSVDEWLVDNPGDGDCMFYAASLALLRIVQHESCDVRQPSPVLEAWRRFDPQLDVHLIDVFDVNDPFSNKEAWDKLQRSLRRVLSNAQVQELELLANVDEAHQILQDNRTYIQFLGFYRNPPRNAHQNMFVGVSLGLNEVLQNLRAEGLSGAVEIQRLAQIFLERIRETNSPLLTMLRNRANSNVWGTEDDLDELGRFLAVNVQVRDNVNRHTTESFRQIKPYWHSLSLFNLHNGHWKTVMPLVSSNDHPVPYRTM